MQTFAASLLSMSAAERSWWQWGWQGRSWPWYEALHSLGRKTGKEGRAHSTVPYCPSGPQASPVSWQKPRPLAAARWPHMLTSMLVTHSIPRASQEASLFVPHPGTKGAHHPPAPTHWHCACSQSTSSMPNLWPGPTSCAGTVEQSRLCSHPHHPPG